MSGPFETALGPQTCGLATSAPWYFLPLHSVTPLRGGIDLYFFLSLQERFRDSPQRIEDIYVKALGSGLQTVNDVVSVHLAFLDYKRRQIPWSPQVTLEAPEVVNLLAIFDAAQEGILQCKPFSALILNGVKGCMIPAPLQ